ncbi:MAG: DUF4159 domain-containing protein [Hyphomicrobiaceae bacterium]|nr:DUF4159 domain-containing protein [Hyphomicrobiaceae bacterium]
MSLGALAFLNPALLGALALLPVIYWLLRTVPPRPRRIAFPATRILVGLENRERTPAKTPWWLTLIRMLAAAFVILALAEPVLNPNRETALKGAGPVVIVVDNGWSAATRFSDRLGLVERLVNEAEAQSRPVLIAQTAPPARTQTLRIEAPAAARSTAAALAAQPFAPRRTDVVAQLEVALRGQKDATVVWLSDGIDHDGQTRAFADRLAGLAGSTGALVVVEQPSGQEPIGTTAGLGRDGRLEVTILRAQGGERSGVALAFSARGQRLGEAPFTLSSGAASTTAQFGLPLELRNQVTRVEIAGERSAGGVHLLDARSRWNRIALISGESREQAQPLLAPLYYLDRALAPFSELVKPGKANLTAATRDAFRQNVSILMLADIGTLAGEVQEQVDGWVKKGGVLVRFAGPRLEKGGDPLLPVALRIGGRTLGGALSWSTPQPLAAFDERSLFAGLETKPEIVVNRQVLADPGALGPEVDVWARLKDGTPLVTAKRHGEGRIILFHITANSDWSNLPLSGLFVDMLRRVSTLGQPGGIAVGGVTTAAAAAPEATAQSVASADVLSPIQVLDGHGVLRPPPPTAQAIEASKLATIEPGVEHPPGYYGPQASPRALNVLGPKSVLKPLPSLPARAERRAYEGQTAEPLKPPLLAAALSLLFLDILAVLMIQSGFLWSRRPARPAAAAAIGPLLVLICATLMPTPSVAQLFPEPERNVVRRPLPPGTPREIVTAIQSTSKVSFGYVLTGEPQTDEISRQGLSGLRRVLAARTAVEPGEAFGVNVVTDEIAFFPILYWPVVVSVRPLPDATLAKIDAYMKQGGMIIFDTRDYGQGVPTGQRLGNPEGTPLQRLLGRLDIPRLEPVPEGHVLTKSFYLMRTFPGRWDGPQLWVEAESAEEKADPGRRARCSDGVSSLLVTGNDFAAAWALDDANRPLYPTVPGGEAQREQAFRTGVNIVMYALTGNYKADQVHVPALLERLGQ